MTRLSIGQQVVILCIRGYQLFRGMLEVALVSGFGFQSGCTQTPTCSEYTIFEVRKRGTMRGLSRGFRRILGCWSIPGIPPLLSPGKQVKK